MPARLITMHLFYLHMLSITLAGGHSCDDDDAGRVVGAACGGAEARGLCHYARRNELRVRHVGLPLGRHLWHQWPRWDSGCALQGAGAGMTFASDAFDSASGGAALEHVPCWDQKLFTWWFKSSHETLICHAPILYTPSSFFGGALAGQFAFSHI